MDFLKAFLAAGVFLAILSCNNRGSEGASAAHYSIASHLDSLKDQWAESIRVSKRVRISDREEEHTIGKNEFLKDLDFFKKLDIARSSYLGRYQADTLREAGERKVVYSAKSNSLEIRKQEFVFSDAGKLTRFFSDRQYNSVVSEYDLKVEILNDSVFVIEQIQDIPGKARQNLTIKYTLLSGR